MTCLALELCLVPGLSQSLAKWPGMVYPGQVVEGLIILGVPRNGARTGELACIHF